MGDSVSVLTPIALNAAEVTDEVWDKVVRQMTESSVEEVKPVVMQVIRDRMIPRAEQIARTLAADRGFQKCLHELAISTVLDELTTNPDLQKQILSISRGIISDAFSKVQEELTGSIAQKILGAFR